MNEFDLAIERVDASFLRIYTEDEGIRTDIYEYFKYPEPGFVKNKWTRWNGEVKLFKKRGNLLPYGCLQLLLELAKKRGWKYALDDNFKNDITKVTMEELKEWVASLKLHSNGIPIEPYDYQMESLYLSVRYNRLVILAATSAGKSLIAYMLTRYYEMHGDDKKTLILVPSQMLVDQMYADFQDYSSENGWKVEQNVHKIMEGQVKTARRPIYISTWQSIYEESEEYFKVFGRVINDETHLASGKSITSIMDKCVNAYQRIGMTGTLKADRVHPILVMSLFGPVKRVVTTKQLIDAGRATSVSIKMLQLDYPEEERQYVSGCTYQQEVEFVVQHKYRNKLLASLASSLSGNTLVMFDRLEHIDAVEAILKATQHIHGKQVYAIRGDVSKEDRNVIKKIAEQEDGIIVLGTAGCVSTGLSIKRLRNLIFARPNKSNITVLQAVGRILRLHADKSEAFVYDVVDDFSYEGRSNFALRHALERVGIYRNDQLPLDFKKYKMKSHAETK